MAFLHHTHLTQGGTLSGRKARPSETNLWILTFELREAVYLCPTAMRTHEWSMWLHEMKRLYVSDLKPTHNARIDKRFVDEMIRISLAKINQTMRRVKVYERSPH